MSVNDFFGILRTLPFNKRMKKPSSRPKPKKQMHSGLLISMKKAIGANVQALREAKEPKMTRAALADKSGVHRGIVGEIETGVGRNYQINSLLNVVIALDAKPEEVLFKNPIQDRLIAGLKEVLTYGSATDISYVIDTIDRAVKAAAPREVQKQTPSSARTA